MTNNYAIEPICYGYEPTPVLSFLFRACIFAILFAIVFAIVFIILSVAIERQFFQFLFDKGASENKEKCRKITVLNRGTRLPSKSYVTDAGYDCYLPECVTIPANKYLYVPLGFAIEIKANEYLQIYSRSSAKLRGISCLENVCDTGYRGELYACLINYTNEDVTFEKDARVVQIVFKQLSNDYNARFIQGDLPASQRDCAGFGSTGSSVKDRFQ